MLAGGLRVKRGIKQGCALSSSLLVPCIDPVLRMLGARLTRTPSVLGARADDAGLCAQDVYRALACALPVFEFAVHAAGLVHDECKCVMVSFADLPPAE
eukprot:1658094-Pyramimonas_sp.AAC.1